MKVIAIFLIFLLTSSFWFNHNFDAYAKESKIPDWVKQIFVWYGQGQISEDELLGAIRFLINNNVITVDTQSQISDTGKFIVIYESPQSTKYNELKEVLKKGKSFETLADSLNRAFLLPIDITIELDECNAVNAFYDKNNKKLIMCYELIEYLWKYSKSTSNNNDEANQTLSGLIAFIFLHEVGHALIDMYDLPITGREEDAVDQLATTILLLQKNGDQFLVSTSKFFLTKGVVDTLSHDLVFWDEHSLSLQRFYNIMCLQYGKDPQKYGLLVDNGLLPKDRAEQCKTEYEKYWKSWATILLPYLDQNIIKK